MSISDKLEQLDNNSLKTVIEWTVRDLNNAANHTNYESLDENVKNWCRMLSEAVEYQVDKELRKSSSSEEE
tara:strand:- start:5600 stop:5812 length:213 start_codon:yes stop_codon:yes gene_type:complete